DLSITLTHTPDPIVIGQSVTFNIAAKNNGPNSATDVTTYLAANGLNTSFFQVTSTTVSSGTCDTVNGGVFCFLGSLASGATATATVTATAAIPGPSVVTFGVGGDQSDPIPANNTASTTVNVTATDDVGLIGSVSPSSAVVGGPLPYTFIAANFGTNPATGVSVTDALPPGVTFVSAKTTQGSCIGGPAVTCTIGGLASQSGATVTI